MPQLKLSPEELSRRALIEFKVAVEIWFGKMGDDTETKRAAVAYAAARLADGATS